MNPIIAYQSRGTYQELQACLSEIYWAPSLTIDEFISHNELIVQDLIAEYTDENAEYVRKLDTQREKIVSFMKDMYEYYIYWDGTYLLCKH